MSGIVVFHFPAWMSFINTLTANKEFCDGTILLCGPAAPLLVFVLVLDVSYREALVILLCHSVEVLTDLLNAADC